MNRNDITSDPGLWFQRMRARFPHLDEGALSIFKRDRACFVAHLARTHNLSINEAREEIEDFFYIETLTHELTDKAG